jgi:hypothetical protein
VLIIEKQRELERQRPTIVARFERVGTIHFLLVVENRGVKQVSVIFYVADQREGLGFNPPHVKESFMRLKPGIPETVDFRAESLPEDGVVRFLVVFRNGNDQWEQLLDVPAPPFFAVA